MGNCESTVLIQFPLKAITFRIVPLNRALPVVLWWELQWAQWRIQGALRAGPPCPQDFFKIMQFSDNFKGKIPILSKCWVQAPLGVKTPLGPPDKNSGSAPGATMERQAFLRGQWRIQGGVKIDQNERETHTECGCRTTHKFHTGLAALNLLWLSARVCMVMSKTCFRHKRSCRSTMPHSVYAMRQ